VCPPALPPVKLNGGIGRYSIADEWAPWMFGKQVGGYRVSFGTNGSAFQFVTVHGAGHMVPSTRPEQGLQVLSNYLKGKW
jgi:serine carboxypeptidase-like clade 2